MAYFGYDDRYGCRVSESADSRSALQKAETRLEACRTELLSIKTAVAMLTQYGWDTKYQQVLVNGVFKNAIEGCEPFYACHTWVGSENREYALALLEKAQKEFNDAYDKVDSLS